MFLEVTFSIYFVVLLLGTCYLGINYCRIQFKSMTHPQAIIFLLPFTLNFAFAKLVFFKINPLFTTLVPCLLIFMIGYKLQGVRVFGLTGGIACGKSTLVKMMRQNLTIEIIDCDQITQDLKLKGKPGYKLVMEMLGDHKEEYIDKISKEIIRDKFSNFVFTHDNFRKKFTNKMGKLIMWQIFKQIISCIISKKNLIMIDAPILYETKLLEYICYPIIVVGSSKQTQVSRMIQYRKMNQKQAQERIASQMPLKLKKEKSEIYVNNEGSHQQLLGNVLKKLNPYLKKRT